MPPKTLPFVNIKPLKIEKSWRPNSLMPSQHLEVEQEDTELIGFVRVGHWTNHAYNCSSGYTAVAVK